MCTLNSFNSILNKKILMLLLMGDSFLKMKKYLSSKFFNSISNPLTQETREELIRKWKLMNSEGKNE